MSEYIVLVGREHYNPLGIIRTLGEAGLRPILVTVRGDAKFIGQSRYVREKHYVDSAEEGLELIISRFAVSKKEKSYILAGDDLSVSVLDRNYDRLAEYFYFYNAGEQNRIIHFMNKDIMLALAAKHGLNVAKTWKVCVGEIPEDIEYPVMTKAINCFGSEWKDIVFICKNEKELKEAYGKIKSKEILLQQYLKKVDEISFDGFSINRGKNLVILTEVYQKYCIPDKYSPYWEVKNNKNLEITGKIRKIIAEIGLEGIFEFEFLVDPNGKLWFLEINFRNTALGYATTCAGMPQVTLWCEAMKNGRIPEDYYREIPEGFTAMAECFDYDARVKTGLVSKKEWKKQYKNAQCKLYRGHDDIIPYWRFLWYKYTKMRR